MTFGFNKLLVGEIQQQATQLQRLTYWR